MRKEPYMGVTEDASVGTDPVEKAVASGRQPAPDVEVDPVFTRGCERAKLVDRLNAENPDFVHSFQAPTVTADELRVKCQEIVRDAKGEPLRVRNDIVVRTPRKRFEAHRAAEEEQSLEITRRVYGRDRDPAEIQQQAKPKKPRKPPTA